MTPRQPAPWQPSMTKAQPQPLMPQQTSRSQPRPATAASAAEAAAAAVDPLAQVCGSVLQTVPPLSLLAPVVDHCRRGRPAGRAAQLRQTQGRAAAPSRRRPVAGGLPDQGSADRGSRQLQQMMWMGRWRRAARRRGGSWRCSRSGGSWRRRWRAPAAEAGRPATAAQAVPAAPVAPSQQPAQPTATPSLEAAAAADVPAPLIPEDPSVPGRNTVNDAAAAPAAAALSAPDDAAQQIPVPESVPAQQRLAAAATSEPATGLQSDEETVSLVAVSDSDVDIGTTSALQVTAFLRVIPVCKWLSGAARGGGSNLVVSRQQSQLIDCRDNIRRAPPVDLISRSPSIFKPAGGESPVQAHRK